MVSDGGPGFRDLGNSVGASILVVNNNLTNVLYNCVLRGSNISYMVYRTSRVYFKVAGGAATGVACRRKLVCSGVVGGFNASATELCLETGRSTLERCRGLYRSVSYSFGEYGSFIFSGASGRGLGTRIITVGGVNNITRFCSGAPLPFRITKTMDIGRRTRFGPLGLTCTVTRGLGMFRGARVSRLARCNTLDRGKGVGTRGVVITARFPFVGGCNKCFLGVCRRHSCIVTLGGTRGMGKVCVSRTRGNLSFEGCGSLLLLNNNKRHANGRNNG